MEIPLYLADSYARACPAHVLSVAEGKFAVLDTSLFSPRGGGLASDTGKLVRKSDGAAFPVLYVVKKDGAIQHEVGNGVMPAAAGTGGAKGASAPSLSAGDEVACEIDWERRHRLMRSHTAGHILSAIMFKRNGILITGNAIDIDKSRFDFSMETFDKEAFQTLIDEANAAIARNLDVSVSYLAREEALKLPGMVKLAGALPPDVKELRIVKIGDVDEQADGGVHVKNTGEIGKIVFLSAENKGKMNRRVYFRLEP
ncbi:MAG: alanyl-tRNA editing protein [Candidatus Micrarchaeota archaeon]|nr:alanyl-tRNA editing protein [Candidatus Micrarchaeota archaeon]